MSKFTPEGRQRAIRSPWLILAGTLQALVDVAVIFTICAWSGCGLASLHSAVQTQGKKMELSFPNLMLATFAMTSTPAGVG
jgi:hypothetical protein